MLVCIYIYIYIQHRKMVQMNLTAILNLMIAVETDAWKVS